MNVSSRMAASASEGVVRRPDGPPEGAEEPGLRPVRQAVSGHRLLQERAGRLPVLGGLPVCPSEGASQESRRRGPYQHQALQGWLCPGIIFLLLILAAE